MDKITNNGIVKIKTMASPAPFTGITSVKGIVIKPDKKIENDLNIAFINPFF
ncbi:hypothetical protein [Seonamhaeicola marinus]|uniref:hypothetical protein n=1 Tax=Seonamhaeicola marinus TaxID=1912246 RepID=UPI001651F353|nr:hypothetical protein [Seonamhaeicola marinus]